MRNYYLLTKPGIIRGNLFTAIAGFLLASHRHIDFVVFFAMIAGTSLIIASACVSNNYLDRDIDKLMARTKNRSLVSGAVSVKNALLYAAALGLVGSFILGVFTNLLTLAIGITGFVAYVFIYGYAKRATVHGTVIGSISGAIPPVAGYTAVTDRIDTAAILLFLIIVFWQMPHFYAIAMYRLKDYKAANIPVLPAVSGMRATKIQILIYTLGFVIASALLTVYGYTSYVYLVIMLIAGLTWLGFGIKGFNTEDDTKWARKMFFFSLIVMTVWSLTLSVDSLI